MKSITLPDGTKKYLKEEMVEKVKDGAFIYNDGADNFKAVLSSITPDEKIPKGLYRYYCRFNGKWEGVDKLDSGEIYPISSFFEDNTVLLEQEVKPGIPDEYKKVMEQMREVISFSLGCADSIGSDVLKTACNNALAAYETLITNK